LFKTRRKKRPIQGRAEQPLERFIARIVKQQRRPTAFADKRKRPRRPCLEAS